VRLAFVIVLLARIAHADIAAAAFKAGTSALALERAHGPYADVRAYNRRAIRRGQNRSRGYCRAHGECSVRTRSIR
jgi:hypothetical protein